MFMHCGRKKMGSFAQLQIMTEWWNQSFKKKKLKKAENAPRD